ncbi:MAG: hypothetical protein WCI03_00675 [bacterium]|jgi:hypothetical protein
MIDFSNSLLVYSLLTCLLLGLWIRAQVWSRVVVNPWKWLAFTGRSALGFLTLLAAAGLAQQAVVFSTKWRLWPLLLLAALLIETVMALARLERNIVSPRAGRALTLLRISTLLAVVLMLCQPVFVYNVAHKIQRHIVVLLDVSASMQIPDNNLTVAEKLRLAESLQLPMAQRLFQVDTLADRLNEASQNLLAQLDWLNALSGTGQDLRARQLKQHVKAQRKALTQVRDSLEETVKVLDETAAAPFLQKDATSQITDLKRFRSRITSEASQPLELAIKRVDDWQTVTNSGAAYDSIRETVQKTATFLAEGEARLRLIGDAVDERFYRSLSESDRKAIDQMATFRRSEVAYKLLTTRTGTQSLLERLEHEYGVQLLTFGSSPTEVKTKTFLEAAGTLVITSPPPRQVQGTDIAGALARISSTMVPEQTAGVLLLTDGRHNTAGSVESIARKFGVQRIPIFPVVLGGNQFPPTDAAIASVTAPESVSTNDRISFALDLKLDGLSGSNVTVTLFDGATPVASNTVTPSAAAFRQQLLLSDAPKTNGLHAYSVRVGNFPSEVDSSNNVFNIPVRVESDAINVLLIDGQPRWEFRYLKNLFMQRDKNVRLQYLLLHPDQVAGITNRPPRAATVAADQAEPEATLLPTNTAEWLKFDVIILGDVAPDELGKANMDILRDYVLSRGGSLIVIAGSRHMPQAYTGTPLTEILPVTFKPTQRPLLAAPEMEFRLSLTAAGRDAMFMRLDDDPAGNLKAWGEVPGLRWRNGAITAKNGATVLAYATPPQPESDGLPSRIPDAESLLKQQRLEQENPLVISHQAGFGSVLMFGFDQTWRMRYKKGDQFHHKLWGQILGWATADRIATGSNTLRIGTSRSRYPAGSPIRVTARLATPDFMPIIKASPGATLWRGDRKVSHFQLSYRESSPGIYFTELSALPEGNYRIELETSGISKKDTAPSPFTEFSVTAVTDAEKVELSADRGVLTSLAGLSAGKVLDTSALDSISKRLGPAKITSTERRQIDIWNSWPWFLLILTLLTAEWMLRKKVRLP